MAMNQILRRRCVEEPKRSQASCISLAPLGVGLQDLDEEGGNGTSIMSIAFAMMVNRIL